MILFYFKWHIEIFFRNLNIQNSFFNNRITFFAYVSVMEILRRALIRQSNRKLLPEASKSWKTLHRFSETVEIFLCFWKQSQFNMFVNLKIIVDDFQIVKSF